REFHEEDGALVVGQALQHRVQLLDSLLGQHPPFGADCFRGQERGHLVNVDCRSLQMLPELVAARSQVIAGYVDRDSRQPCAQTAVAAESLAASVGAQKSVLSNGLRQVWITGRVSDEAANSRLVHPDQFVNV